ncbi:MAG: nucleotidyltransferase domain-containing protein [Actinobacteria bacterium]|nr:nucleotidyltransferase domain-containing protein [Actinomycetota bacterium]MCG2790947.1 nucleotidyltransferase domain-containing protein [Actinomycetes bacterium]
MAVKTDKTIIEKKVKEYLNVLKKSNIGLKALYLFGSTNKDIFNSDSDIDIAVVVDSFGGDIVDIFSLLLKLRRNIDIRIEPHPFEVKDFNDSNPFACEIIRTGKKIS